MGAYSAINAAGVISVTTTGDATIGQLNSSLSYAAAGNAPSIIVTAGGVASLGAIIDNGDGQTKFVASGAGAELSLSASNGIGSATSRLGFNAARLSASASAGGIYLKALTDTEASLLSAVKGSVDILGTGGLTLDQVLAGTAAGASGSFSAVTDQRQHRDRDRRQQRLADDPCQPERDVQGAGLDRQCRRCRQHQRHRR